VERWDLPAIDQDGKREPRVLFSTPECRALVIDLNAGEEMRDHQVRERAVVQVVAGRVSFDLDGSDPVSAAAGTLVTFAPRERHAVRAEEDSRILLLLAPWPATDHYDPAENVDPNRLPRPRGGGS
jgi:quercetin dioxygenase-like cupin family protein